jgi:hypothetical protein
VFGNLSRWRTICRHELGSLSLGSRKDDRKAVVKILEAHPFEVGDISYQQCLQYLSCADSQVTTDYKNGIKAAMEERLKTEQQMIRYLLGDMSIEEQIAMETGYFNDPEKFNLLQVVEHDLIEGYINGKLSASGRVKFEQHFLNTPARRDQVRFFQTLTKVLPLEIEQQAPEQTPVRAAALESIDLGQKSSWWESILSLFRGPRLALGMSFAAAMLILAVAGTWLIVGNRGQGDEQLATVNPAPSPDPGQVSNPDKQKQPAGQQTQEPDIDRGRLQQSTTPKPTSKSVVASFFLTIPVRTRGEDINKSPVAPQIWRIPPDANLVQMTFNHRGDPYNDYKVMLRHLSSGQRAWSRSDVRASRLKSGTLLVLNVPAQRFDEGSYSLEIYRDNAEGEWVLLNEFLVDVQR